VVNSIVATALLHFTFFSKFQRFLCLLYIAVSKECLTNRHIILDE